MEIQFINKEISWLSFNARVLQEAANESVPLIERIKFLGICSSNLDEFYRVRVATLKRLTKLGKKAKKFIGEDPKSILKEITRIALSQHNQFDKIYRKISKGLANENIFIIDVTHLTPTEGQFVLSYFRKEVRPKLIPIMLDQAKEDLNLRDRTIYLAVCLNTSDNSTKTKYALIEIPSDVLPRFLILPTKSGKKSIIFLDDVIRLGLNDIFATLPFDKFDAYTIKVTRDAELDIDNDISESYIEKLNRSLKQRKAGDAVRFIYDKDMPQELLDFLIKKLLISKEDTLIAGSKYHNNRDFMDFPKVGGRSLRYDSAPMLPHKDLNLRESMLQVIRQKDILLHFPYQSFNYIIDLLREASIDPKVTSIKLTVYRVAKNSSVMNALINAVKNGKSVTAVLELQARFDEEANIYWANRLQEEGVKVIFGVAGLKVHSKLCLISCKENGNIINYAMIGTGNFNEVTAKIYSDHSLFTSNRKITREVERVFDFFENPYLSSNFKHLLVSPNYMRKAILKLINKEIKNAKNGKDAFIFLKLNNLVDSQMIEKLYEASEAGVRVQLNVRGMFSLVPGIDKVSSSIEAISIVDKYLEHSRIFIFGNAGDPLYYISSADWMPRNLDRRIEVTCPIYDKSIQKELLEFIARILNEKLDNQFKENLTTKSIRAQWAIYDYLKNKHT
jgi:polyphosphate kinase